MVCDSLRYWAEEMHVDGFRFDLGTILAREPGGFDTHNGFMKAVMQDPRARQGEADRRAVGLRPGRLPGRRLPAGLGGVERQVPRHRARLLASARRTPAALAPRLCGSPDIFNRRGRQPWASVNFITAHDGFTLNDLVTYNDKHNEANGEDNRTAIRTTARGTTAPKAPTDDEAIRGLRKRQMRTCSPRCCCRRARRCCSPATSSAARSSGNNNAYCQDNEISWVDWNHDERAERLINFVRKLTGLRRATRSCAARASSPASTNEELGVKDVTWINTTGEEMREEHWKDANMRCFGMLLDGRAQTSGIRKRGEDATLLIVFNPWQDVVKFKLPPQNGGTGWTLLADTNFPDSPEEPHFPIGHEYEVTGARCCCLP